MLNLNFNPKVRKLIFVLIPLIFIGLSVLLGTFLVKQCPKASQCNCPKASSYKAPVITEKSCEGVDDYYAWIAKKLDDKAFKESYDGKYIVLSALIDYTGDSITTYLPRSTPFKVKIPEGWSHTIKDSSGGTYGSVEFNLGSASITHSLASEGNQCLLTGEADGLTMAAQFDRLEKVETTDKRFEWYIGYKNDNKTHVTVCGRTISAEDTSKYGSNIRPVGYIGAEFPEGDEETIEVLKQYIKDIAIL